MKLKLIISGPDGRKQMLEGEALPLHERPSVPFGITIDLAPEDYRRLQEAAKRLQRCASATSALGEFQLSFRFPGGIVSETPINEMMLKVLALEARPFFLNDDPLFFPSLVKLKSFSTNPNLARAFRGHTKRWKTSAFNGAMNITIGAHPLDVENVVAAWFNSDFFHTGPMKPDALSLSVLKTQLGGDDQARAILGAHLNTSLVIVNEFLTDVEVINNQFKAWRDSIEMPKSH
jgi:hypothetical protein